jgi:hypothetical protein
LTVKEPHRKEPGRTVCHPSARKTLPIAESSHDPLMTLPPFEILLRTHPPHGFTPVRKWTPVSRIYMRWQSGRAPCAPEDDRGSAWAPRHARLTPPPAPALLQNLRPFFSLQALTRLRCLEAVSRAAWRLSGGHRSFPATIIRAACASPRTPCGLSRRSDTLRSWW